jgi:hypothetical protein
MPYKILIGITKEFMKKIEEKMNQLEVIAKRIEKKETKTYDPVKPSWILKPQNTILVNKSNQSINNLQKKNSSNIINTQHLLHK